MLLKDLAPASFRGVPFRVPKDTLSEGRRIIEHFWPDSNRRYAEDNGFIPPEFTVTAILHGANLPGQLNSLRNALNTPGPGTLKHPWAGVHRCAVKGPFKIERSDQDGGVITIELCFVRDDGPIFPSLLSGIPAQVASLASAAIGNIGGALPGLFGAGALTAASRDVIGGAIGNLGSVITGEFGAGAASRVLSGQFLSLADDPSRIASSLMGAVEVPFVGTAFSDAQVLQGFRALSDQAASITGEALSFGQAAGILD